MMRIALTTSLLAACGGWSKHDTGLELAALSTLAIDGAQTRTTVADDNEINPMISQEGAHIPVAVYFPATMVIHAAVAMLLPAGWMRTTWQTAVAAFEVGAIQDNLGHGYGLLGGHDR